MKRGKKYKTEAELCRDFIAWVTPQGWTAYPETAGWDIVLVRGDGTQIGIQAKLAPNLKVLSQTIGGADFTWIKDAISGPDYRAIVVPKDNPEIRDIARALGITVFSSWERYTGSIAFSPEIDDFVLTEEKLWPIEERIKLPNFIPDVVAGTPCPLQLTDWKIKALRITAILELRGFVTREDFKKLNLSFQRWPVSRWLKNVHMTKRYVRGERLSFDKQHPAVYVQVKREVETELAEAVGEA